MHCLLSSVSCCCRFPRLSTQNTACRQCCETNNTHIRPLPKNLKKIAMCDPIQHKCSGEQCIYAHGVPEMKLWTSLMQGWLQQHYDLIMLLKEKNTYLPLNYIPTVCVWNYITTCPLVCRGFHCMFPCDWCWAVARACTTANPSQKVCTASIVLLNSESWNKIYIHQHQ